MGWKSILKNEAAEFLVSVLGMPLREARKVKKTRNLTMMLNHQELSEDELSLVVDLVDLQQYQKAVDALTGLLREKSRQKRIEATRVWRNK